MNDLDSCILKEQQLARQFVEKQGLIINDDNTDYQRDLVRVYDEIYPLFHSQLEQVGFRYLYSWMQSVQRIERFRTYDGYSSHLVNPSTEKRISAIGISAAAIALGHDYIVLVLLHELTHLLVPAEDHTIYFHAVLDDMLREYNARFGTHIENDYFGLPTVPDGHGHAAKGQYTREDFTPISDTWRAAFLG